MVTITAEELKQRLSDGDIDEVLVDVRENAEFKQSRIPEAKNIPLGELEDAIEKLKRIGTVYVHCASGGRSARACQLLADAGVNAVNVGGGITAWEAAGFTVVKSAKQTLPIMRQVMISAGSLTLIGTLVGYLANEWGYALAAFVGAGLLFAGVTGKCGMMYVLNLMPWNR